MTRQRSPAPDASRCAGGDIARTVAGLSEADWAASVSTVPDTRVASHLGLPPVPGVLDEWRWLIEEARRLCVERAAVWVGLRHHSVARIATDFVELAGGARLHSPLLVAGFRDAGASSLVAGALCAGHDLDRETRRLWDAGRPDAAMALNAYGSALIEELRLRLFSRLREVMGEKDRSVLPYLSPGYEGWPLEDQENLFIALGDATGPIELLDSGGLRPSKSVLVVFGLTRAEVVDQGERRFWEAQRRTLEDRGGRRSETCRATLSSRIEDRAGGCGLEEHPDASNTN